MTGPVVMIVTAAGEAGAEALLLAVARLLRPVPAGPWWAGATAVNAFLALVDLIAGTSWYAAGEAIAAGIAAVLWWLSRRKRRDRARRWLGAKSKALRDAIVRKARELSVPRPVLAPGGAR